MTTVNIHCRHCGRKMRVNPNKRFGGSFYSQRGALMRNFGECDYPDGKIVGVVECPSGWCRFWNYSPFCDHYDYMVLDSGQIISQLLSRWWVS